MLVLVAVLLFEPTAQEEVRVVRVFPGSSSSLSDHARDEEIAGIPMADASGRRWTCKVARPNGAAGDDTKVKAYDDKDGTLPRLSSIESYERDRGTCLESPKVVGYWAYELCPGTTATQFRIKAPSATTKAKSTSRGESHALGTFVQDEPRLTVASSEVERVFPGVLGCELDDGIVFSLETMRGALVERYVDGEGERAAMVYVACLLAETQATKRRNVKGGKQPQQQQQTPDHSIYDEIRIARVVESPIQTYNMLLAAPRQMCSRSELGVLAIARELRHLHGTCLQKRAPGEWWTYEVCVGHHVRQFHAEDGSGFLMGKFETETKDNSTSSFSSFTLSNPPKRHQFYSQGDACDINGVSRSATVHFHCASSLQQQQAGGSFLLDSTTMKPSILSVVEIASCEYEIVVTLPAACAVLERTTLAQEDGAALKHIDCEPAR